jgi:catechol 2,3-dioxygenase-like lactoylglutathione lyase family enzyme
MPLRARLHHLALTSPSPRELAVFYAEAMGGRLSGRGDGWCLEGTARILLVLPGPANTAAFAAYACDPSQLRSVAMRLAAAGWPSETVPTDLFAEGAICVADPDGNRLVFGTPLRGGEADFPGLSARLQHYVVASRDPGRLLRFYEDVLGFALSDRVVDEAGELRAAFLRSGEEHHSFACFRASRDRIDHHCYDIEDWQAIRDWSDHLAAKHIPLQWGPGRHGPGNNLFAFFHDPDGNWVELSAELERVAPDRPAGVWPHEQRTLNLWGLAPLRS